MSSFRDFGRATLRMGALLPLFVLDGAGGGDRM